MQYYNFKSFNKWIESIFEANDTIIAQRTIIFSNFAKNELMSFNQFQNGPLEINISFHKVIENLEYIAKNDPDDFRIQYAKSLLNFVEKAPELKDGLKSSDEIEKNKDTIRLLLADLFPSALTNNEIKAATIPFSSFVFNKTNRLHKIIKEAGEDFSLNIRDFDDHNFYVMSCCLILNAYYGQKIDFVRPLFYDIPDENGILRHYRILYNADFIEIFPTENAKKLSNDDIEILLNNYDDLDLWMEKFPPKSWILKGFGIFVLFDATTENAISNLKSSLLKAQPNDRSFNLNIEKVFQSIFKVKDIRVGFTPYQIDEDRFNIEFSKKDFKSYLLLDQANMDCKNALCGSSFDKIMKDNTYFSIADIAFMSQDVEFSKMAAHLLKQNIKSIILAPVVKDGKVLGVIELVSSTPFALNSVNAHKVDMIMPFLVDTIDRYQNEWRNKIDAIIQKEYTAMHPSVYWKFKNAAQNYLAQLKSNDTKSQLAEIVFNEVYPLYGQIDVKGSSEARNEAIQFDLKEQFQSLLAIFEEADLNKQLLVVSQRKFELVEMQQNISKAVKADSEYQIQNYLKNEILPVLSTLNLNEKGIALYKSYLKNIEQKSGLFYNNRKKFDTSLSVLNKELSDLLDLRENEAQAIFPHYYERFKTDGVEHNLYIGAEIAPNLKFDKVFLKNLRLWQLQTMCEMVVLQKKLHTTLTFPLEMSSLILVFSAPISIRFRMDEKRFDIDGSYNARYEVIKKRIDKSYIKNTKERITQQGKITIVFTNDKEEVEYRKYIKYLQHTNIITPQTEYFEVEDLQGVSGLKALRIEIQNP